MRNRDRLLRRYTSESPRRSHPLAKWRLAAFGSVSPKRLGSGGAGGSLQSQGGRKRNQELFIFKRDQDGAWKIARYSFSPTSLLRRYCACLPRRSNSARADGMSGSVRSNAIAAQLDALSDANWCHPCGKPLSNVCGCTGTARVGMNHDPSES